MFCLECSDVHPEEPEVSVNAYKVIEFLGLGSPFKENLPVVLFMSKFFVPEVEIKGRILMIFKREHTHKIVEDIIKGVDFSF